jgi:two-component system cell cycle sensor histidine kinase/response regulator CckA
MHARKDAERRPGPFEDVGRSGRDVLVAVDADGSIVLAGPGIEPLLGWTADELARRPLETILPEGETRARRRDGTDIPIEVTSVQLGDTRLVIIHDVRRRRALRAVLEGLPDATVASRRDGRIVFVNERAEELFGYSSEELVGQPVQVLWPERVRDRYTRNMDLYFGTEHPLRFTTEARGQRKDGTEFVGEMSWGIVETHEGPLLLAIGRDISPLREAVAALRRQSQQQSAVVTLGELALSGAGLAALSRSAVECIRDLLPVMRVVVMRRGGAKQLAMWQDGERAPGEPLKLDLRTSGKRLGSLEVAPAAGTEFADEQQAFLRAVATMLALAAERAAAEEQLRQAQKMEAVGQLAGGIAHDFNNLLTVIAGYSAIARERIGDGPGAEELDAIAHATERAAQVTGQLLAFSRRQVLEPAVLDLNEVARGLAPMLSRLIGEDVALTIETADGLAPVVADRGQVAQVILNLAVNARDAMPVGGTLRIETRMLDENRVGLIVTDTGVGMDPAILQHAFEPFYTTKDAGQGTGLGLATVHGIVEQSGGQVAVDSEPGRGTTFTVSLPAEPAAAGARAVPAAQESEQLGGDETVLVCEDEEGVRRLVEHILASNGYRLLVAALPSEALRLAADPDQPIDAIVTDVIMPEMPGPELAERVQALRPGVRTIFVSGYTAETLRDRGRVPQGSAFIQKPFEAATLLRTLRDLLDQ